MTRVKICGITNVEDALAAVEAGADAIGLVFAESPRQVAIEDAHEIIRALPPFVSVVGVYVNAPLELVASRLLSLRLDALQLHGDEPPDYCEKLPGKLIKRFNIREMRTESALRDGFSRYRVSAYLLDPGAGSGETFDWEAAVGLPGPLIVSGGLTPANVGSAVRLAWPFAVDVASGVELEPGKKDVGKMREFVAAVRDADATRE